MSFQIGDVVKLKSGGPNMTVSTIKQEEIWCAWFDNNQEPKKAFFKPNMLEKV